MSPGDRVDVSGTPVRPSTEHLYFALHKPAGVMTTLRDPEGRKTIASLLPRGPRVVPVGRLDYDTSGLLLLTNDGELAHRLMHPSFGVEKTYRATIAGRLDAANVRALLEGVRYEASARSAPAKLRVVAVRRDHSVVDVTIHEGRNRQVRKMFEAVGHPVLKLERIRFGPVSLGSLPAGSVRPLTERERAALGAAGLGEARL